ncbi:MAG: hypothetical protein HQM09_21255 [Candidatus Riflebacteria bacterium]|nr:hypothetical protein [Candidatus Riflebacteria bacterium]
MTHHTAFGFCRKCGVEHALETGDAVSLASALMTQLESNGCIDFELPQEQRNPGFSLDYLWGEARGKMFGVADCIDANGKRVALKAFSCQYQGRWEAPGWAPPLLDPQAWDRLVEPVDREIKSIGLELERPHVSKTTRLELREQRKILSQALMRDIHELYEVSNFCGERRSLSDVFIGQGIPTGAGDCCAPKLLHSAVSKDLRPLGIAEFFWGRENLSHTRRHRLFYSCCQDKCQPLLGFMLCGIDK